MPSVNPEVLRRARNNWYRKNKTKQIKRQLERRAELKKWFWDYKRTLSCNKCGRSFKTSPECCDFHHLDKQQKEFAVGIAILSSKQAMLREMNKCVPMCANCHRTEHKDHYRYS